MPPPSTMPAMPMTSMTPPFYQSSFCCLTFETQVKEVIGPDGQPNPLPEVFSLAPRTAVHVSRHIDTAISLPATGDYASVPAGMNMTYEEWCHLGLLLVSNQINYLFLLAIFGQQWMTF
jgi:hypothetical protein